MLRAVRTVTVLAHYSSLRILHKSLDQRRDPIHNEQAGRLTNILNNGVQLTGWKSHFYFIRLEVFEILTPNSV